MVAAQATPELILSSNPVSEIPLGGQWSLHCCRAAINLIRIQYRLDYRIHYNQVMQTEYRVLTIVWEECKRDTSPYHYIPVR